MFSNLGNFVFLLLLVVEGSLDSCLFCFGFIVFVFFVCVYCVSVMYIYIYSIKVGSMVSCCRREKFLPVVRILNL